MTYLETSDAVRTASSERVRAAAIATGSWTRCTPWRLRSGVRPRVSNDGWKAAVDAALAQLEAAFTEQATSYRDSASLMGQIAQDNPRLRTFIRQLHHRWHELAAAATRAPQTRSRVRSRSTPGRRRRTRRDPSAHEYDSPPPRTRGRPRLRCPRDRPDRGPTSAVHLLRHHRCVRRSLDHPRQKGSRRPHPLRPAIVALRSTTQRFSA